MCGFSYVMPCLDAYKFSEKPINKGLTAEEFARKAATIKALTRNFFIEQKSPVPVARSNTERGIISCVIFSWKFHLSQHEAPHSRLYTPGRLFLRQHDDADAVLADDVCLDVLCH